MSLTPEPTGVAQGPFFLAGRLDAPRRAREPGTDQEAAGGQDLHGCGQPLQAARPARTRGTGTTGNARNTSNRCAFDVRAQLLQFRKQDTDACAQRGDTLDRGKARIAATRARVK